MTEPFFHGFFSFLCPSSLLYLAAIFFVATFRQHMSASMCLSIGKLNALDESFEWDDIFSLRSSSVCVVFIYDGINDELVIVMSALSRV